jgi:glycosyltransferase involved in cell wall biosynthesis
MRDSNSTRRLVVFVEHFPPFLGSDRTVFELAKRIADTGVQIHFIVTQPLRYLINQRPPDWEYKNNWSHPPPKIHRNISAEYLLVGRSLHALWRNLKPLAYLLTVILFSVRSIKALVKFNPSVIVVANASPIVGIVAFLSTRFTAKPFVIGCPDWMSAYVAGLTNRTMNSFGPVIIKLFEFSLYRWADRVFASTNFLKKLLVSNGVDSGKIVVIPNGVDVDLFNPNTDVSDIKKKYHLESRFVVLFSGHLEDWAGIDLVYDLAKCLSEKVPNSTILLVGEGASTIKLLNRLIRSNLSHMVTHAGLHPHTEMPYFTAVSDVALCLFPDSPVAHAASPLKLFEDLASRNAVVATRVAGTTEVIDNTNGLLVRPGSAKDICDAVIKLSKDKELRNTLGINGRKLVEEKYSWSKLARVLLDICESLNSEK